MCCLFVSFSMSFMKWCVKVCLTLAQQNVNVVDVALVAIEKATVWLLCFWIQIRLDVAVSNFA